MSSYESFSDSQSSQDFSQSLESQNSYGSQSLEMWDMSYDSSFIDDSSQSSCLSDSQTSCSDSKLLTYLKLFSKYIL